MANVQKKRGAKNQTESFQEKKKAKSGKQTANKKLVWYVSSNWME
jgi:hypothetical protein